MIYILQNPIELSCTGWTDALSGLLSSTYKVFRLEPDVESATKDLTEVNPRSPIYTHTDTITSGTSCHTTTYTPPEVGMYSVLVEIADKANNTNYARRLVLYDPSSSISINQTQDSQMYVKSAVSETGYKWQSNTQDTIGIGHPIIVNWENHFENHVHSQGNLLNKVQPFQSVDYPEFFRTISVNSSLDDHEGKRTIDQTKNVLGIVKAEFAFMRDKDGGKTLTEQPTSWTPVTQFINQEQSMTISRADGDTVRIWVKVTDVLNNTAIDTTDVHIDSSPPETFGDNNFQRNIKNGTYPFMSRYHYYLFYQFCK